MRKKIWELGDRTSEKEKAKIDRGRVISQVRFFYFEIVLFYTHSHWKREIGHLKNSRNQVQNMNTVSPSDAYRRQVQVKDWRRIDDNLLPW